MDAHTESVPPWRYPIKVLLILNRAQAFFGLLALLNFTTLFCENRYLVENNHPAIVSRERFRAVQAEQARRSSAKSPSVKNSPTGRTSYASKYALSERLVCGECGTLYRRCTWSRNGQKKVVWRCVSRLDYGTKYCHESPTMEEGALQQAIMAAINSIMDPKENFVQQIMDSMEQEIVTAPNSSLTLGEIK